MDVVSIPSPALLESVHVCVRMCRHTVFLILRGRCHTLHLLSSVAFVINHIPWRPQVLVGGNLLSCMLLYDGYRMICLVSFLLNELVVVSRLCYLFISYCFCCYPSV